MEISAREFTEREERIYADGIAAGREMEREAVYELRAEVDRLNAVIILAAAWPKLPNVLRRNLEKAVGR